MCYYGCIQRKHTFWMELTICCNNVGGSSSLDANLTFNNFSLPSGLSIRAYDSATAENQLPNGSLLNKPWHKRWLVQVSVTICVK